MVWRGLGEFLDGVCWKVWEVQVLDLLCQFFSEDFFCIACLMNIRESVSLAEHSLRILQCGIVNDLNDVFDSRCYALVQNFWIHETQDNRLTNTPSKQVRIGAGIAFCIKLNAWDKLSGKACSRFDWWKVWEVRLGHAFPIFLRRFLLHRLSHESPWICVIGRTFTTYSSMWHCQWS